MRGRDFVEGRRTRVGIKKAEGTRPTTFYDVRRSPGNLLRLLFQVSRRAQTRNTESFSSRNAIGYAWRVFESYFPLLFVAWWWIIGKLVDAKLFPMDRVAFQCRVLGFLQANWRRLIRERSVGRRTGEHSNAMSDYRLFTLPSVWKLARYRPDGGWSISARTTGFLNSSSFRALVTLIHIFNRVNNV